MLDTHSEIDRIFLTSSLNVNIWKKMIIKHKEYMINSIIPYPVNCLSWENILNFKIQGQSFLSTKANVGKYIKWTKKYINFYLKKSCLGWSCQLECFENFAILKHIFD